MVNIKKKILIASKKKFSKKKSSKKKSSKKKLKLKKISKKSSKKKLKKLPKKLPKKKSSKEKSSKEKSSKKSFKEKSENSSKEKLPKKNYSKKKPSQELDKLSIEKKELPYKEKIQSIPLPSSGKKFVNSDMLPIIPKIDNGLYRTFIYPDDFSDIAATGKKGGYGEIIGAKFKDTGEEIVLKKNLYYKKSRLMFMDIIHEVIKITRYYI